MEIRRTRITSYIYPCVECLSSKFSGFWTTRRPHCMIEWSIIQWGRRVSGKSLAYCFNICCIFRGVNIPPPPPPPNSKSSTLPSPHCLVYLWSHWKKEYGCAEGQIRRRTLWWTLSLALLASLELPTDYHRHSGGMAPYLLIAPTC